MLERTILEKDEKCSKEKLKKNWVNPEARWDVQLELFQQFELNKVISTGIKSDEVWLLFCSTKCLQILCIIEIN
jgi:hypothetical protein